MDLKVAVVDKALGSPNVTTPGPLTLDQATVTAAGSFGSASSLTVAIREKVVVVPSGDMVTSPPPGDTVTRPGQIVVRVLLRGQPMPTSGSIHVAWDFPPQELKLDNHEVHVWCAALDRDQLSVQRLWPTLAADERARAQRFHFQKDRKRFVVRRGLLRAILGRYQGVEPDRLQFCYGPHGKPELTSDCGGETLCFNLSHSEGLALYAVTRQRRIGVDLEYIRPELVQEEIAERFFSPREVAALRTLSGYMQQQAFFDCWTRKEAYIKAVGEGLSLPLDQFDVSLRPGERVALLRTTWDPQEACRWLLQDSRPGPRYAGALCVEGHDWQLACWQCAK